MAAYRGTRRGAVAATLVESGATVERAKARSLADWNRSAGDFSRQRWIMRSTVGGTEGFTLDAGPGSSSRIAAIVWAAVSRSNVRRPVTISWSTVPRLKMSVR
jgi:hypothetical protein